MTTLNDLLGLAKRTITAGDPDLAGQISVLALETFDDKMFEEEDPQAEQDQEVLNEKPLLEALQDGTDEPGMGYDGPQGEIPIATVLEMSAVAKKLFSSGYKEQARQINKMIKQFGGVQ